MKETKLSTIREDLTEATSAILYAYRRNCAASTGATQVRLCPLRDLSFVVDLTCQS